MPNEEDRSHNGNYWRGKTNDTLMDRAIEGAKKGCSVAAVEKICLINKDIKYCENCQEGHRSDELWGHRSFSMPGAVEKRGVDRYKSKAHKLGRKLTR